MNVELAHEIRPVGVYRPVADKKFLRNFFIGHTHGYMFQNFEFPEEIGRMRVGLAECSAMKGCGVAVERVAAAQSGPCIDDQERGRHDRFVFQLCFEFGPP